MAVNGTMGFSLCLKVVLHRQDIKVDPLWATHAQSILALRQIDEFVQRVFIFRQRRWLDHLIKQWRHIPIQERRPVLFMAYG